MLKVIAYTGGHNAPSRVPRVQHYIPYLKRMDIEVLECPSRAGLYPPLRRWLRPAWGAWNLCDHAPAVLRSYQYDVTLLQREMLSTFITLEPFTKRPRVLDVDDAIWAHRRGGFARRLAGLCDHVICGNRFLAEEFSRWNPNVSVLPTSVDANRFCPRPSGNNGEKLILGWLGLSAGFRYLYAIEPALRQVLERNPRAVLHVISDQCPRFPQLPAPQVRFIPYSQADEVAHFQEMTIGLMPLDDSVVSRGKCSFKMLQCMACGLPVVVSPVGMNNEVLQQGEVGLTAASLPDWVDALETLLRNPDLRTRMGRAGRAVVLEHYSVEVLAGRLAQILLALAR